MDGAADAFERMLDWLGSRIRHTPAFYRVRVIPAARRTTGSCLAFNVLQLPSWVPDRRSLALTPPTLRLCWITTLYCLLITDYDSAPLLVGCTSTGSCGRSCRVYTVLGPRLIRIFLRVPHAPHCFACWHGAPPGYWLDSTIPPQFILILCAIRTGTYFTTFTVIMDHPHGHSNG